MISLKLFSKPFLRQEKRIARVCFFTPICTKIKNSRTYNLWSKIYLAYDLPSFTKIWSWTPLWFAYTHMQSTCMDAVHKLVIVIDRSVISTHTSKVLLGGRAFILRLNDLYYKYLLVYLQNRNLLRIFTYCIILIIFINFQLSSLLSGCNCH